MLPVPIPRKRERMLPVLSARTGGAERRGRFESERLATEVGKLFVLGIYLANVEYYTCINDSTSRATYL